MKNTIEEKASLAAVDTEQSSPVAQITTTQPAADTPKNQTKRSLSAKHYESWVQGRKLDASWVLANISSVSTEEARSLLGYPVQSAGIWIEGANLQGQFRPDKPWQIDLKCKAKPKYLTASGTNYDAILPNNPSNPKYWNDLEALRQQCYHVDGHPCLLITEGVAKAIAGCSNGIPTIALLGVEMGLTSAQADLQGKRYLVPALEKFAKAGFGFIIAFDADAATNKNVISAQLKLEKQLSLFSVPTYSVTGLWSVDASFKNQNKGMDDYIQNHTSDAFKGDVLAKARAASIESWEQQFEQDKPKKGRPPAANVLARQIADKYREKLAWNIEIREWFSYGLTQNGIWEKEPKEAIEQVVRIELDANLPDGYTHRYLTDILNLLKSDLLVKKWNQTRGLIPLQNGVLHKKTKKLSPHSPGYRLTYCLPFAYDPAATCEPIVNWLRETVGQKEELVTFLLVYLNAIVNQRADLQRYLELIGPGGTGKSTYMKLASYLIGERNVHTTKHQILEESRFETANLAGKLLTLITEADQYVGAVNVLKAITGQDSLHYEQKMKQAGEGFIYEGMVITAGNEPSRSTDYTSGLARRKIPIWFRNFIPASERRDLDSEFKPYLPGLLNLVLTYSDEEVTDWLRNAEKKCPSLHEYHREMLCETNPIADWIDNKVLREPGNRLTPTFLYNAYKAYSEEMGQKSISQKRFSSLLIDLVQVQLGWSDVKKDRDRHGRFILGLALRLDGDFSPFPITEASEFVTDKPVTVTDSMTAETTAVYGCDGCDGFLDDSTRTETVITSDEQKTFCVNDLQNDSQPVTRHQPVTPQPTCTDEQAWEAFNQKVPYPNPKSDNERSSQNRVQKIREAIKAANTKEDLSALKRDNGGEYSFEELKWTQNFIKFFYPTEYNHLMVTRTISQPNLLS